MVDSSCHWSWQQENGGMVVFDREDILVVLINVKEGNSFVGMDARMGRKGGGSEWRLR